MGQAGQARLGGLAFAACVALAAAPAAAQLLGESIGATALDTRVSNPVLIYDADFYSPTEGRLLVVGTGTALAGPRIEEGATQAYYGAGTPAAGAGEPERKLVLELRIDRASGALVSGAVRVPLGLSSSTNDRWSVVGTITDFGISTTLTAAGAGTVFDARWNATGYDLSGLTPAPSAPATCAGSCGSGGLLVNVGGAQVPVANGTVDFSADWVRGAGVSSAAARFTFDTHTAGIDAAAFANAMVSVDLWLTPAP